MMMIVTGLSLGGVRSLGRGLFEWQIDGYTGPVQSPISLTKGK
jgi:hypothetical protein